MERNIDYFNCYKNTKVLVTGGAGFIGSNLVEKLIDYSAKVTIIDNLSSSSLSNLDSIIDKVNIIQNSIEDFDACLKATYNQEIIFHMAALVSVPECENNPINCYNTNVTGTSNILEAARINKTSKLIFSSSSAVYGDCLTICKETTTSHPISCYGYSKLMGEILCKQYTSLYNLDTTILRYFNVYGPNQSHNSPYAGVMAKFKHNIKNNKPITIYGDGTQTRDFVSVDTVVEANLKIASPYIYAPGEVFNIASGKSISLLELFNKLKSENPDFNQEIKFEPTRPGDIKFSATDLTKYNNLESKFLSNYFYNQRVSNFIVKTK